MQRQLAECEANFLRCSKIMRLLPAEGEQAFCLRGQTLWLEVVERAPYTSLLSLRMHTPALSDWADQRMQVRVYHDARMAEVVTYQGQYCRKPRNDYPNAKMQQVDEKRQRNRFLAEWLSMALRQGAVQGPVSSFSAG